MTIPMRTRKIGLTGSPGAGKSSVLKILAQNGVPTLQTDHLGHELLRDKEFGRKLVRRFGRDILDNKGMVDRAKLGRTVFQDPVKRDLLNRMTHPWIRRRVAQWVKANRRAPLVVVEVPLLFERGFYRFFDANLSISAPLGTRRKRLRARGWDLAELRKRERSQWPQIRKDRKADWVLRNNGSPAGLRKKVALWLAALRTGPQGPKKRVF